MPAIIPPRQTPHSMTHPGTSNTLRANIRFEM